MVRCWYLVHRSGCVHDGIQPERFQLQQSIIDGRGRVLNTWADVLQPRWTWYGSDARAQRSQPSPRSCCC